MLGSVIADPHGIEADAGAEVQGLGLLDVRTDFTPARPCGSRQATPSACRRPATRSTTAASPSTAGEEFLGGARAGNVFGTMWHGSLEGDELRGAFLAAALGRVPSGSASPPPVNAASTYSATSLSSTSTSRRYSPSPEQARPRGCPSCHPQAPRNVASLAANSPRVAPGSARARSQFTRWSKGAACPGCARPRCADPVARDLEREHRHDDAVLLSHQAGLAVDHAFTDRMVAGPAGQLDPGAGDLLASLDRVQERGASPPPSAIAVASGSSRPNERVDVLGLPGRLKALTTAPGEPPGSRAAAPRGRGGGPRRPAGGTPPGSARRSSATSAKG